MLRRFPLVACSLLPLLAGSAAAQSTLHVSEDFANGAVDWFEPAFVQFWHITAPSECGAPAKWATCSFNGLPCRYGSPPWAFSSELSSHSFVPTGGPLELSFLSRLEIDAADSLAVYLEPPSVSALPLLALGTELDLSNDSQIEQIVLWAPEADLYAGLECRLLFVLFHDGVGDTGFGWMIDEVRLIETPVARPFCIGDGSEGNCPCANFGGAGEGCANSSGTGARLASTGSARLSQDDLMLQLTGAPATQPAVLFRGNALSAVPFRDGLLCLGAPHSRVESLTTGSSGRAETSSPVGSASGATPGDRQHFQVWFRDPQSPCGNGSNFSAGVEIDWI